MFSNFTWSLLARQHFCFLIIFLFRSTFLSSVWGWETYGPFFNIKGTFMNLKFDILCLWLCFPHIWDHIWNSWSEKPLWLLNIYFFGIEEGFGLSDGPLLKYAEASVFFFLFSLFAFGGLLPLCTKPLSDCKAVKQSPISTGNSGFQVQVYSSHATTLQRLVITICSLLYILTSWLTFFFLFSPISSFILLHLLDPLFPSSINLSFPHPIHSTLTSSFL